MKKVGGRAKKPLLVLNAKPFNNGFASRTQFDEVNTIRNGSGIKQKGVAFFSPLCSSHFFTQHGKNFRADILLKGSSINANAGLVVGRIGCNAQTDVGCP